MGMFDFLKKKPRTGMLKVEMRSYVNGREVPLKQDAALEPLKPHSYYEALTKEIKPLEEIMVGFAVALNEQKRVDDRIELLKALVQSFYDLKSKCVSLGPDCTEYFSEMWEHCHNAKNPDFCYVERFETELAQLQANRDELVAKEALHDQAAEGLNEKVLAVLKENPEILQTEIYAKFDPIVKSDIQSILYSLTKAGAITREKTGRTYKITYRT